jgi:L-malate glycosyltransferase
MHVMLLAPGFSVHAQRFLQLLLSVGHQVTFVDAHNPIPAGAPHYAFISYPSRSGLERFGHLRTANRLGEWAKAARLRYMWERVRPDIVHVHFVDSRAYYCALARLHPLVLTCWGTEIIDALASDKPWPARERFILALSRADQITADSDEILDHCETLVGHDLPRSLFYFGIDLQVFRPNLQCEARRLRQTLGIAPTTKVLFSIRRLARPMGQNEIFRAFADAISDGTLDAVLVVHRYLAQSLEYEKELEDLASQLGISNRLIWIEPICYDQMPIFYAMADLVVNFPFEDGLPVSLFEAAACKRPVITSNLRAYQALLGEAAFTVVPSGDTLRLQSAIRSCLLAKPQDFASSLRVNYDLIAKRADQREWIARIQEIYAQLVTRSHNLTKDTRLAAQ